MVSRSPSYSFAIQPFLLLRRRRSVGVRRVVHHVAQDAQGHCFVSPQTQNRASPRKPDSPEVHCSTGARFWVLGAGFWGIEVTARPPSLYLSPGGGEIVGDSRTGGRGFDAWERAFYIGWWDR